MALDQFLPRKTSPRRATGARRLLAGAALALVGGLAACGPTAPMHQAGPADYREAYPIHVEMKTFAIALPVTDVLELQARPAPDFVNAYRRRGRGPITIVLPDGAGPRGLRAAEALGWWLDGQMIEAVAVQAAPGVPGASDRGSLTLFFEGHVALVPECGDWTGETGFNPTNLPHTNFGCAYQRNIGLMLSDPGDLVDPKDLAPGSGYRAATVIGKWYAGEYTGAAAPHGEQGTVTTAIGSAGGE